MGKRKRVHRRPLDRGARGRSAPRHARREDQCEREGPCRSQLNDAAIGTLSPSSVSSAPARSVRRQSSNSPCRSLPLSTVFLLAPPALPLLGLSPSSTRPASLLPSPAPSPSGLSLLLSHTVLRKHFRCCTHGMLQAPVSRAHATRMREMVREQGVARTQ